MGIRVGLWGPATWQQQMSQALQDLGLAALPLPSPGAAPGLCDAVLAPAAPPPGGTGGVPVVVVLDRHDWQAARSAVLAGARAAVALPDEWPLLPALLRQAAAPAQGLPGPGGRCLAITAPRGGQGASTVAAALALALQLEGGSAGAVDLHLPYGCLHVLLGLRPDRSLLDLVPVLDELRPECLAQAATLHPGGLRLLASPADGGPPHRLPPHHVPALLAACRDLFACTVVHAPPPPDPLGEAALAAADLPVLVTRAEPAPVAALRRLLDALPPLGQRAQLLVNRHHSGRRLAPADVVAATGLTLAATLPDDPRVERAHYGLEPLVGPDPRRQKGPFAAAVVRLARQLSKG
jgi:pilus assembly protein CpaE